MRGDGDWVEMKTRLLLSCCKGHLSLARKSAHVAGPARVPGRPHITWCVYRWVRFSGGGFWTDLRLRDAHLPRQCSAAMKLRRQAGHAAVRQGELALYSGEGKARKALLPEAFAITDPVHLLSFENFNEGCCD